MAPFMEITTIDNKVVDTAKQSALKAEMIELVEKSGLREFAVKHDGVCYVLMGLPNDSAWATMHLNTGKKIDFLLGAVNEIFMRATDDKFTLTVQPVQTQPAPVEATTPPETKA